MKVRQVVTSGGGENLYKINEYSSTSFTVYKAKVKLIGYDYTEIGSTRNLEDALTLIRSYSGNNIDRIGDW